MFQGVYETSYYSSFIFPNLDEFIKNWTVPPF